MRDWHVCAGKTFWLPQASCAPRRPERPPRSHQYCPERPRDGNQTAQGPRRSKRRPPTAHEGQKGPKRGPKRGNSN
eukprot:8824678-Pyramimonas_sp.AAC.1